MKTALLSCVDEKALTAIYITVGRRNFWKPVKSALSGDTAREATSDEVKQLRSEATALKETLAELLMENRLLKKKRDRGWGGRYMRYTASEKV